jgi:flagellar motor protein MotB
VLTKLVNNWPNSRLAELTPWAWAAQHPNLISAQGFGDADPVAPNNTPQGRAQNHRVVLSVPASGC